MMWTYVKSKSKILALHGLRFLLTNLIEHDVESIFSPEGGVQKSILTCHFFFLFSQELTMQLKILVSLIVREFARVCAVRKPIDEVTPDDVNNFILNIQCRSQFVITIVYILFNSSLRSLEVRQLVEMWFHRPSTLIAVRCMFFHLPRFTCDTDIITLQTLLGT